MLRRKTLQYSGYTIGLFFLCLMNVSFGFAQSNSGLIRIKVTNNFSDDETLIVFGTGNSYGFSGLEDAIKFLSPDPTVPSVYTLVGTQLLAVNALPWLDIDYSVPVGVRVQTANPYVFEFTQMQNLPASMRVYFQDLQTGHLQSVFLNSSYSVSLPAIGQINNRFRLIFTPPIQLDVTPESCNGSDGSLLLSFNSDSLCNITFLNSSGITIDSFPSFNGIQSLTNLAAGNYVVNIEYSDGVMIQEFVTVGQGFGINANVLSSADTLDLINGPANFTFIANAIGATAYSWDFGDGTVINNAAPNISHTYTSDGTYQVVFEASNAICSTQVTITIVVIHTIVSGLEETISQEPSISFTNQQIIIETFEGMSAFKSHQHLFN
jgi:PKD repeat protein